MRFSITMIKGTTRLSMTTFRITTFSIIVKKLATLSMMAEDCYADCRLSSVSLMVSVTYKYLCSVSLC
jgi:hypothetical protein